MARRRSLRLLRRIWEWYSHLDTARSLIMWLLTTIPLTALIGLPIGWLTGQIGLVVAIAWLILVVTSIVLWKIAPRMHDGGRGEGVVIAPPLNAEELRDSRRQVASLKYEEELAEIRNRSATDPPIKIGTLVESDGVPWVWDGEKAHARCPDHRDTNLEYRADGAGGKRGVPADGDSLVTDHLTGGHMICPKHTDDRMKLGGSTTYGEARQRAEDKVRAASSDSRPNRRGLVGRRGSLKLRGFKSRGLDTAIETDETEIDAEDVDIE